MPFARLARTHGDWALAVGLAALLQAELWTVEPDGHGVGAGGAGAYGTDERVAAAAVALGFAVSLAWRRRVPLLVLTACAGFALAARWLPVLDAPSSGALATVVATYSAGAHTAGRAALAGAAGVAAVVAATAVPGTSAGDIGFIAMIVGGAWLAGRAMRHRREREAVLRQVALDLEREREVRARAAVAEERVRIARELHDVVAHGISVMVLQARGARRSLDDPDAVREALDGIESTGSGALAEMRRLVGMLRRDDEEIALAPRPSLRHVEALAGQMREAGLRVELSVEGQPGAVPPGVDLAAYRIVQEALTNTLKHAGQVTARVAIRYGDDDVEVEVSDTGRASGGNGAGHGLVGMRERVSLYGGDLQAGGRHGGGFTVRARLPFGDVPR